MKLGIFGGTFDPIHLGHLRAAENAREALGLDRVDFITSRHPPHREAAASSPLDRFAMVVLATAGNTAFVASEIELRREGPSYTVETVAELRREHPADDFVLIIGSDAFRDLQSWKEAERLLGLCTVAVVDRPETAPAAASTPLVDEGARIARVEGPGLDVSATVIRERVGQGRSIRYLVPDAVADYVEKRGLYR